MRSLLKPFIRKLELTLLALLIALPLLTFAGEKLSPLEVLRKTAYLLSLEGKEGERKCEIGLRKLADRDLLDELECTKEEKCDNLEILCGRVKRVVPLNLKLQEGEKELYIYTGIAEVLYWNDGNLIRKILRYRVAIVKRDETWKIYQVILESYKRR